MKKKALTNLIYMGNWGRGNSCINALCNNDNLVVQAVFTQYSLTTADPYFNLVHDFATNRNIPIVNTIDKSSNEVSGLILDYVDRQTGPDIVGLSVAFDKIFKRELLAKLKIINLHPSLLPKYRGPSPELWAIKNREKYIGITLHWVNAGIDTGNIIYQDKFEIDYDMTYLSFIDWLNVNSAKVLSDFFAVALPADFQGKVQDQLESYFARIPGGGRFYRHSLGEISDILNRTEVSN